MKRASTSQKRTNSGRWLQVHQKEGKERNEEVRFFQRETCILAAALTSSFHTYCTFLARLVRFNLFFDVT